MSFFCVIFKIKLDVFYLFFPASDFDIIDEAIYYFKANIFFRNYEIKVGCLYVYFINILILVRDLDHIPCLRIMFNQAIK